MRRLARSVAVVPLITRLVGPVALSLLLSMLVACGGSGGSGGDHIPDRTGILVDSPVSGVAYASAPSGKSGTTGPGGEYEFSVGDTVTFSIGDIEFPPTRASAIVTVLDLAGAESPSDTTAANIARLLQSLDDDGDISETITITAATTAALTGLSDPAIDFGSTSFETELAEIVSATGISLVAEADAVAHLTSELRELRDTYMASGRLPEASIAVDGSADEWLGVLPVAIDARGDQNGDSSTDLVSLSVAIDCDTMFLLMETAGPIAMPHTPGQEYSHYEVGVHLHSDSNCEDSLGFVIVNNFTHSDGTNYHRVESYTGDVDDTETVAAFATTYLETSFNASQLFAAANSIWFHPYTQSFGEGHISHDSSDSGCYDIGASGTGSTVGTSSYELVGAWLLEDGGGYHVLVFVDDSRYVVAHTNNSEFDAALSTTVPVSAEYGIYTWDPATGAFSATALGQSDGEGGLSHPEGDMTIAVDGDSLTIDASVTLTKVSGGGDIVGAWYLGSGNDYNVLVFVDDGRYIVAHTDNSEFDPGLNMTLSTSAEHGTYTWDSGSGAFANSVLGESDGEGGLSDPPRVTTSTVDGDTLTLTDSAESSVALTRIE